MENSFFCGSKRKPISISSSRRRMRSSKSSDRRPAGRRSWRRVASLQRRSRWKTASSVGRRGSPSPFHRAGAGCGRASRQIGGQQVVGVGVESHLFNGEADGKQLLLWVEEEAHLHFIEQAPDAVEQVVRSEASRS